MHDGRPFLKSVGDLRTENEILLWHCLKVEGFYPESPQHRKLMREAVCARERVPVGKALGNDLPALQKICAAFWRRLAKFDEAYAAKLKKGIDDEYERQGRARAG